ncbi:hypothetical protein Goarm_012048 [Gossypium armourianum]|uniref:SWIB domain-containing protein n=1 Tax=Gossypium armourianum TaxID=34283 RepID=A0A7J9IYR7_9ROSI|nr:hypothetical protein [Gossypium armourianum]
MFRLYKGFKELLASSATAAVPSTAAKFYAAAAAKSASPKVAKKTPKKPTTSKPKTKKPAALRSETRPTGISKVTPVSPALGQFLGAQQASRTEAVKQIWSYIKSQNLQVTHHGPSSIPWFSAIRMLRFCLDLVWKILRLENWNGTLLFLVTNDVFIYFRSFKNQENPSNRKEIFCDEKLKTIFNGKEKVGFLEIGKMLTPHFVKTT